MLTFFSLALLSATIQPSHIQMQNPVPQKPHIKYRNIIFDIGNVLLEWNPAKIVATVLAKHPTAKLNVKEMLQFTSQELWLKMDMGTVTQEEVEKAIPAHLDKDSCLKFIREVPYSLLPIPDGVHILKTVKAKGYRVYILSNMSQDRMDVIRQNNDFFKLCDGEVFSCDTHTIKPDPAIYQTLLKTYNLDAHECLFLDDVQVNIDAANKLGIDGIICKDHKRVIEELKRLNILD